MRIFAFKEDQVPEGMECQTGVLENTKNGKSKFVNSGHLAVRKQHWAGNGYRLKIFEVGLYTTPLEEDENRRFVPVNPTVKFTSLQKDKSYFVYTQEGKQFKLGSKK